MAHALSSTGKDFTLLDVARYLCLRVYFFRTQTVGYAENTNKLIK